MSAEKAPCRTTSFAREAAGKTVAKITATNEPDFRSISIDFTDKTSLLAIAVGTAVAGCPPHRPGRALISASGSYLG
jgi:hypothetical protein